MNEVKQTSGYSNMLYEVRFSHGRTKQRFQHWQNAKWYLTRVLGYKLNADYDYVKDNGRKAEIYAANGIPF